MLMSQGISDSSWRRFHDVAYTIAIILRFNVDASRRAGGVRFRSHHMRRQHRRGGAKAAARREDTRGREGPV